MRAIETAAIEAGEVTGLELMERAGRGVVEAVFEEWPELAAGTYRAVVLCGPGNNGGDGFVIARVLEGRGWTVELFHWGDPERLPVDAARMRELWGGESREMGAAAVSACERPALIVDAVFGTGLTRPLPEPVAEALDVKRADGWKGRGRVKRVAVDCPSGLNLDDGMISLACDAEIPQHLISADLTVTFHAPKLGHFLGLGPTLCGRVEVVDIGLKDRGRGMIGLPPDRERVRLVARPDGPAARVWPLSLMGRKRGGAHKYDHGSVAVFAGGVGRGGAARLAARAALRVGAGLVTVVAPKAALIENAARLDAVMLRGLGDVAGFDEVVDPRVSGFVIGPGLGVGTRAREIVAAACAREDDWRRTVVVLDADALTSFEEDPASLFALLHERCILTPHEGEFRRLFPDLTDGSKVDRARSAAARAGCVVLLKGSDTIIASPSGGASVHSADYERSAPWLATAGAGDVLAGLIAGLAASPVSADLHQMAEAAAWLHVECAREFGPGLIAEDLPEMLPRVLARLEAGDGAQ
ncbi:NAD(P)H-hydrate dehydratase [Vannielia litorea]|nr:NAD(P)H-hydrate dehydratase [Vannielia litorea]MBY6074958.1 NAD(P)H-hydrate dehydratase [Vannielia litorea]